MFAIYVVLQAVFFDQWRAAVGSAPMPPKKAGSFCADCVPQKLLSACSACSPEFAVSRWFDYACHVSSSHQRAAMAEVQMGQQAFLIRCCSGNRWAETF